MRPTLFIFFVCCLLGFFCGSAQGQYQRHYNNAVDQISEGNYDSALYHLNRSIVARRNSDAFFLRASVYQQLGEDARAITDYTSTIQLSSEFVEAYFKRGELYLKNGVYTEALEDFNYVINKGSNENTQAVFFRIDPTGVDQVKVSSLTDMMGTVLSLRSQVYQAMGDYKKAARDINKAIETDSSSQNLVNRALLMEEMGERMIAIANLNWAIDLNPENEVAWFNLMLLDESCEVPLELYDNPSFAPMLSHRAVKEYEEDNLDQAERLFKQALKLNPEDPDLLLNIGRLNFKRGKFKTARKQFTKALTLDDSKLQTYYLIGNTFFREQLYAESVAYYEQFLVRDRSNGQVWFNAAMAYFQMDRDQEACSYLNNALSRGIGQAQQYLNNNCNAANQ